MIYALIPYTKRMDYTIKKCIKMNECSDSQTQELKILKASYLFLGLLTILIQAVIVYLVVTTI
jgi:hypothetical protein